MPMDSFAAAHAARHADAKTLADLLRASRVRTLATLQSFSAALGLGLIVPQRPELNPPLWELGHIAWFQEWWLGRNPERALGYAASSPTQRATPSLLGAQADACYDSAHVSHSARWSLLLPDLSATLAGAQAVLEQTLALVEQAAPSDDALYFYRLALLHEDMHAEAAVATAQMLGIPLTIDAPRSAATESKTLHLAACDWPTGQSASGFAFDNELGPHSTALAAFDIDSHPLTWQRYLPFVEQGGYTQRQWWSIEGWQWLAQHGLQAPRHTLRQGADHWKQQRFGQWQPLDPQATAVHLSLYEAQAWCSWAGRQLPTEAQWECAALQHPSFAWGQVWEWTASPFAAYPGFTAHPYREYSAPWFDTHTVLRGASYATSARMAHPRYRNFYQAQRNDVFAGFRSCS